MAFATAGLISGGASLIGGGAPGEIAGTARDAVNRIGGILGIGGGPEPNAGTSTLLDTLDNYEAISTQRGRQIVERWGEMIVDGASNRELAKVISDEYGDPTPDGVMSSWKWDLVESKIREARNQLRASQGPQSDPGPTGGNPDTIYYPPGGGGMAGIPQWMLIAIVSAILYAVSQQ